MASSRQQPFAKASFTRRLSPHRVQLGVSSTAGDTGQLYGIGYTAAVEPSVSGMGYITTVLTAAERWKAGPKPLTICPKTGVGR